MRDLGRLTEDETAVLAMDCLTMLPDDRAIEVINAYLKGRAIDPVDA